MFFVFGIHILPKEGIILLHKVTYLHKNAIFA